MHDKLYKKWYLPNPVVVSVITTVVTSVMTLAIAVVDIGSSSIYYILSQ